MVRRLVSPGRCASMTDKRSAAAKQYRKWYKTARWQRMREAQLSAHPLCRMCHDRGIVRRASVVDHVEPHKGDEALFWDVDNHQSLCKPCHDTLKQREEVAAGHSGPYQYRPEWLRPSAIPLTIVSGPPASGKTTYVTDRAGPNDLVIDLDIIASTMSGQPVHGWDRAKWLAPAMRHRNALLGDLSRNPMWDAAWLIISEADPDKRQWWADKMKPDRVVVLEVPAAVCMGRVRADDGRNRDVTFEAIGKWWSSYGRRDGDEIEKTQ